MHQNHRDGLLKLQLLGSRTNLVGLGGVREYVSGDADTLVWRPYALTATVWASPGGPILLASYWLDTDTWSSSAQWDVISAGGLWERVSHSSIETQGRGGSFSTSGQCLWVEPLGLLQVFWYYEGSNAEDKADALRMTKQKWCKAPGSLMMSLGHKINCGVAYLLFVKPFWVGVLCYFQSKLT